MANSVSVSVINETIIGPAVTSLPAVDSDVLGGFQATGFVEVEKTLSFINSLGLNRTLFLEKKLPFQTTVIELPNGPFTISISLSGTEIDCLPFTLFGAFLVNGVGIPGIQITFTVTGPATVSPTTVTTGSGGTFTTTVTPLVPGQLVTITATSTAVDGLPSVSQNFTFSCSV
ncbi:hypothetical protein J5Y03_16090 [Bacillus sp. RG28]|uniref:Uncharacterized protein n=1 Tax=Gottfriedia endophytica TaxID=2820819 RepID=A0A940SL36_9BACI|nr:hypothetical protein [Gottfriedia endophytica]MBP0726679.1 hypothetical protein [Gottfriedia endophytica]